MQRSYRFIITELKDDSQRSNGPRLLKRASCEERSLKPEGKEIFKQELTLKAHSSGFIADEVKKISARFIAKYIDSEPTKVRRLYVYDVTSTARITLGMGSRFSSDFG